MWLTSRKYFYFIHRTWSYVKVFQAQGAAVALVQCRLLINNEKQTCGEYLTLFRLVFAGTTGIRTALFLTRLDDWRGTWPTSCQHLRPVTCQVYPCRTQPGTDDQNQRKGFRITPKRKMPPSLSSVCHSQVSKHS